MLTVWSRQMARRMMAILLVVLMICSFTQVTQVLAAEGQDSYSQQEGLDGDAEGGESQGVVPSGGAYNIDRSGEPGWNEKVDVTGETITSMLGSSNVIILTEDITLSSAVTHSGDLTIFGNGHTLAFGASGRINLSGSGALAVYDLNITAATATPSASNSGAGVFCADNGVSGLWTADFYSVSFSGAALVGTNKEDSFSMPASYFNQVTFHEASTLVAKDYRALNAVVFARNVTIEGTFAMSSDSAITTNAGARVGYYFKSPGTSSPVSEYSTGARGTHLAYGTFEVAKNAKVTITRAPNTSALTGTNVYIDYLRSVIYGYENHIFGENATFYAKANTNRNEYEDMVTDHNGNAANYRSAIIRSEAASAFIVQEGAQVTLETDESVLGSGRYGFTALLLRRASALNIAVEAGATLDVTANGNFSTDVVPARARAPIMIMGTGNTTTYVAGTINVRSQNGNGWYYAYNDRHAYDLDVFTVDGGAVNITANGSEGNRAATAPTEYAAFEHYNDNTLALTIKNGGTMQINITGWRAMSLAGTALSGAASVKTINIDGAGSALRINPDGADGKPTGYTQFAIAAEGFGTFNLNVTNGGEMYARNTQDSNIYTVGTANYNVSGSGSKLTLIKTGTNSTGTNKYSLYGAIFHDTTGPLNIRVEDGGYMWVESNYGSRAAICAQTYSSGQSNITVDGSGSQLYVINRNTDLANGTYIADSALYPIGAIAFAANTSGNITVSNGANFYAESHNPISPTIALGAYYYSTPTGVFTAENPGEIDIRNDGVIQGSGGKVDIRGIALRGRNNYSLAFYEYTNLGKGTLERASDSAKTIDVKNGEITVYERNGGYDKESFEDWGNEHIIRHWSSTTFSSVNVGTTGGVKNTDGSAGVNGAAVSSGTTGADTDFTLNDYGRIYIRGVASNKTVASTSEAGVGGAPVKAGDVITYSITYFNYKDVTADLVITDVLPAGLAYVEHTGDAVVSGNTITWRVSGIDPDTGGEVTLQARVTAAAAERVTNKATLEWSFADDTAAKQEPEVTNPLIPTSVKYVSDSSAAGKDGTPVRLGDEITYEIKYINNTGAVSGVTITDVLPVGVSYVSSSDGGNFDGTDTVTWSVPTVAVGGSGTVTVTIRLTDVTATDELVNKAQMTWDAAPEAPEQPEAINPVGASKYVDASSATGVDGAVVKPGEVITYTIKYVNNTGEDNAQVTITDELSRGLIYQSGTATGDGSAVPNLEFQENGTALVWTITNLAKDASGTVSFQVEVSRNLGGLSEIVNKAELIWKTSDGTEMPDEAEATNPVINPTGSQKYVAPGSAAGAEGTPVQIGDEITYVIEYTNSTGVDAVLSIEDPLKDKGLAFVSATEGGSYDPATETVTWSGIAVPVNGSGTVSVTVRVTSIVGAEVTNQAILQWERSDGKTDTERPEAINPRGSIKYISSAIGKNGTPVSVGDELTYTITYANITGKTATVTITDALPAGLQYVSSHNGQNPGAEGSYDQAVNTVTFTIADVPVGATGKVTVTVKVTGAAGAAIVNKATVSWADEGGGTTAPEEPGTTNPVQTSKYVSADSAAGANGAPVRPGDEITYEIKYVNNTGSAASLTIADTLPGGVEYVSHTDQAGNAQTNGDSPLVWTIENVPAGTAGAVRVTVRVTEAAAGLVEIVNKAALVWTSVSGGTETEEEPEVTVPVGSMKYIADGAGAGGTEVRVGDELTYTIAYINNTGASASVTITDTLPAGVRFVRSTGGGSYSGGAVKWAIDDVAAGATGTVTVTVRVTEEVGATIENKAVIRWEGVDGKTETEQPETTNPVASSKYVSDGSIAGAQGTPVRLGEEITYGIKYVNHTGSVSNVTIEDVLPDAVEYVGHTGGGNYNGTDTVTWSIENVAAGEEGVVTVTVRVVDVTSAAVIKNKATVIWSADAGTPETPETENPIGSSKYVDDASAAGKDGAAVKQGDKITYTIQYINNTGITANVIITDVLPLGLENPEGYAPASYDPATRTLTWEIADVAAGGSGTVSFTATVGDVSGITAIINKAGLTWIVDGNPLPEDAENSNPSINPTQSFKRVSESSAAGANGAAVHVGDLITYDIVYVNATGSIADLTITDTLGTGLAFVSATQGGAETEPGSGVIVWTLSGIAQNATGTVSITVRVTEAAGDTVQNSAAFDWGSNGSDEDDESGTAENPTGSKKEIAGANGSTDMTVNVGDEITYKISYINRTGAVADVTITDTLPTGLEYLDSTGDATHYPANNRVVWVIKDVEPDQGGEVTVTVRVTGGVEASVRNVAELVWSDGTKENPGTETPVGSLKYIAADSLGANGAVVHAGDVITYEIRYANQTGARADLRITDQLKAGLRYLSHTESDGAAGRLGGYDPATNTVTWEISDVPAGAAGVVTITVRVTTDAAGSIQNKAELVWNAGSDSEETEEPPVVINPTGSAKYVSAGSAGAGGVPVAVGDEITYTIAYVNNYEIPAYVTITDTPGIGLKYLGSTPQATQNPDGTLTWEKLLVNPGEGGSVQVTLLVTEDALTQGRVTNHAGFAWDGADGEELEGETATAENLLTTLKRISLVNGQKDTAFGIGDVITYEILYVNNTGKTADVTITDVLPKGLQYISSSDNGQEADATVTWTIAGVGAGQGGSVTVEVKVTDAIEPDANGVIKNTATVAWSTEDEPETPSTEDQVRYHTVTYHANGGTGGTAVGKILAGSAHAVLAQSDTGVKRSGYTFLGWGNAPKSGVTYPIGEAITVNGDVTLYAQWSYNGGGGTVEEPEYVVTYLPNGGTGAHEDTGIAHGSSYRVLANTTAGISRRNYIFTGWNTKADGTGTHYTTFEQVVISKDMTLYAQWKVSSPDGGGETNPTIDIDEERPPLAPFTTDHFAYIIGYPDGFVRPENNILRSEVATAFFRLLNESVRYDYWSTANDYHDVSPEAWYNNSISVMTNLGVITGYPNGDFGPVDYITRGELAAIAARFARLSGAAKVTSLTFNDTAGHWAEPYILYAASVGWLNGYTDGSFRPDAYITRAEFIAIVNRMLERAPEHADDLLPGMIAWPDNANVGAWYYLDIQEATNSHHYQPKKTLVPGKGYHYETWTEFRQLPNWSALEKPTSKPYDLVVS